MKFVQLPEHNCVLNPAKGDEETVQTVTCLRELDGFTIAVELEAQDLVNVMNGSPLRIKTLGEHFHPMAVWTERQEPKKP